MSNPEHPAATTVASSSGRSRHRRRRRLWPFAGLRPVLAVLVLIAIATCMLALGERARQRAADAREAEAVAGRLLAAAEEQSSLKAEALVKIRLEGAPRAPTALAAVWRGRALSDRMIDLASSLRRLAPNPSTRQMLRDLRAVKRNGLSLLARTSFDDQQKWLGLAASVETTTRRVQRTAAALTERLGGQAVRADRDSRIWQVVSLLGAAVALLLLAALLSRAAQRSKQADLVRDAERLAERRVRALVEHAADVVVVLTEDGRVGWMAPSVRSVLGRDPDALTAHPFLQLVHPDDWQTVRRAFAGVLREPGPTAITGRVEHSDGSWIQIEALAEDRREDDRIGGVLLTMRDVSERLAFEQRLRHQATHDPLTDLLNRRAFDEQVRAALATTTTGVVFLDLDGFKAINDSLGHDAGDEVLVHAADRILSCVSEQDVVARHGGDEFAVLLRDVAAEAQVLDCGHRILAALRQPVTVAGRCLRISGSVGVTLEPPGTTTTEALRHADTAMYAAKRLGKHRAEAFSSRERDAVPLGPAPRLAGDAQATRS